MVEVLGDPAEAPSWIDAIDGRPVDWSVMLERYRAIVDWPGAVFWHELSAANPNALVLLSMRDPESWYRSASNTIFLTFEHMPPEVAPWLNAVRRLLHDRFSDDLEDPTVMMDVFGANDAVRAGVPANRREWTLGDGWEPICDRLGMAVPAEPFPVTNSTNDFRDMIGMPPLT